MPIYFHSHTHTQLSFFILNFNYINLFLVASRFTQKFYRAHFTIIRANTLTSPRGEYGWRCYPVRANKRWRTWEVVWGGGGSKVADKSRPLYLLLFFSWRLNGSRFLIEKHTVNARRGRFYARKTGPRLLAARARACRICMKFVARTRRAFYGIIATTSLECQFGMARTWTNYRTDCGGELRRESKPRRTRDRNPNHNTQTIRTLYTSRYTPSWQSVVWLCFQAVLRTHIAKWKYRSDSPRGFLDNSYSQVKWNRQLKIVIICIDNRKRKIKMPHSRT